MYFSVLLALNSEIKEVTNTLLSSVLKHRTNYSKQIDNLKNLDFDSSKYTIEGTNQINWDSITASIKGADDTVISYFKTLDTGKGTLDTASASVEGMAAHLSNSGQLFDTSALKAAGFNMALNAGISLAMALGARLYDSLSVTLEEQTAIVDALTKSYTHLQKEANALQFSSPNNLTAKEQKQLDFLERKIKLERESLLLENQKLAHLLRKLFPPAGPLPEKSLSKK